MGRTPLVATRAGAHAADGNFLGQRQVGEGEHDLAIEADDFDRARKHG